MSASLVKLCVNTTTMSKVLYLLFAVAFFPCSNWRCMFRFSACHILLCLSHFSEAIDSICLVFHNL